jgi:hypothetical protein
MAVLCLSSPARPAYAAGCHVPERPILATKFSWDQDTSRGSVLPLAAQAPPIVAHLPCEKHVPRAVDPPTFPVGLALVESAWLAAAPVSDVVAVAPAPGPREPRSSRLDRPPRARAV